VQVFLEKVINHIISGNIENLEKCCFVVPNRRTGLYLKKYLSENLKQTIFSPNFFSIEEFAVKISGLEVADNLTLLSFLYQSYKESLNHDNTSSHPFDEFIAWGNILLADFNDIDTSLADYEKVFSCLSEAKAISQWNPENPVLTPFQKNYLNFYNSLAGIYKLFTEKLLKNKMAYQGLVYKHIVQNNLYSSCADNWEKVFFVGFNALTPAEENIVDFFIKNNKGQLIFDYDHFYLDNKLSEAGDHIRKGINKWGKSPFHDELDNFKSKTKNIQIIGIPQNIGQAKICGILLSQLEKTENPNDTALVLSKEDLLFPVLNAIPDNIKQANVTMGFPLDKTLIFDLFDSVIVLYENALRVQKLKTESHLKFNIKDIIKIIENPFLSLINEHESVPFTSQDKLQNFSKKLLSESRVFYTSSQFAELVADTFSEDSIASLLLNLICSIEKPASREMTSLLSQVLNLVKQAEIFKQKQKNELSIEIEFLYYYAKLLKKLQQFLETNEDIEVNSFKALHKMLTRSLSVPFTGEPLTGLQIMGLLETRNLDFKNVILLSVNEGVIPLSKSNNSFIPIDIRRHFHLQVYYDNESIYAYHFYRLLQRAENVFLIYNTEHDKLGSSEKSRFISQLQYELPKLNPSVSISEHIISAPLNFDKFDNKILIEKNDIVINLLKDKISKGISPTSFGTYLQCKLRFYFQNILGLAIAEEPEETIDAAKLGSAIHDVLEQMYKPLVGKNVNAKDIAFSSAQIENFLIEAFRKNNQHIDTNFGKNHLLFKMAYKYIVNFLKEEHQLLELLAEKSEMLIIDSTEKKLETLLNIDTKEGQLAVKLHGRVDRIDVKGQLTRIIDYKTGAIDARDLKLKEWEMLNDDSISTKIIQLMVYSYLYASNFKKANFVSGFFSLRKPDKGLLNLTFPDGEETYNENIHDKFEDFMKNVFSEIFDKEKPINQTDNEENCKYCDFKKICNRI